MAKRWSAEEEARAKQMTAQMPRVMRLAKEDIYRTATQGGPVGVTSGLIDLDRVLTPCQPGQLISIIGRPGHYKSGLAQWWARRLAQESLDAEAFGDVVMYVTWEMSLEELGKRDISALAMLDPSEFRYGQASQETLAKVDYAAAHGSALPMVYLGHSSASRTARAPQTIWTVEASLHWLREKNGYQPKAIFLDYLNLIQPIREIGRPPSARMDYLEITRACKDMALALGCPVFLLAQAKREVDDRDPPIPSMRDAQETAALEQFSDKMLSTFYPIKVYQPGMRVNKLDLDVTPNVLLIKVLKQKDGPSGDLIKLYVDAPVNFIGDYQE